MALTLNTTNYPFRDRLNDRLVRVATFTGPASYVTGGVAIDNLGDFGWVSTDFAKIIISDGTSMRVGWLDRPNQKIKFFVPNTNVEVANAVDLSGFSGQLLACGK
jgi:hypothetical protein